MSPAERLLQICGGVLVAWLALLAAIAEAFFIPVRLGEPGLPAALLVAVVVNLGLPGLSRWLVGGRGGAMLPSLLWFLVILAFAAGTAEGDVVLAGDDWVALALLLVGSAAAATGTYFALLGRFPGLSRVIRRAVR